jgi:hypothetical protein
VLVIVFEVTLAVLYSWPVTRPLNPSFGFVAASLTMSDKVEATVSKVGVLRGPWVLSGSVVEFLNAMLAVTPFDGGLHGEQGGWAKLAGPDHHMPL